MSSPGTAGFCGVTAELATAAQHKYVPIAVIITVAEGTGAGGIQDAVAFRPLTRARRMIRWNSPEATAVTFGILVDQVDQRVADSGDSVAALHLVRIAAVFDSDRRGVPGGGGSVHRNKPVAALEA